MKCDNFTSNTDTGGWSNPYVPTSIAAGHTKINEFNISSISSYFLLRKCLYLKIFVHMTDIEE